jgi:hypothetical protein
VKLSFSMPRLLAIAAVFITGVSCSEKLDSSGVCNVLCPPIGGEVLNKTIDAVVVDTTVPSLSGLGTEAGLLLANRGDTLDTRIVLRFDSLPEIFQPVGDTSQKIQTVDSAFILFQLDTTSIKGAEPVTIEAYDVDTTANDTSTAAVLALFRPDRFISSQTFGRAELVDSVRYFISNAALLAKIQNRQNLRIGLRATGIASSQMRFLSFESGRPAILSFRATPDTATKPLQISQFSKTPADESIIASHLSDYTVIAKAPPPASPTTLSVGGLSPPRRVYFKFDIPSAIVDSSTILRATLLLNQIPNAALDPTDTILVLPQLVLAGTAVTDPERAAQILASVSADTLKLRPGDSGVTNVELARAFSLWRTQRPDTLPRAIVLKLVQEGNSALEIRFSSSEDVVALLRPQLRISYTPRVPVSLP